MPYNIQDLCEELGAESDGKGGYTCSCLFHDEFPWEKTSMVVKHHSEAASMFPSANFGQSDFVAYIPAILCNSLPNVNKRGRCFTEGVMRRSMHTAQDTLIDVEHNIKENGYSDDRIIGHIKAIAMPPASQVASESLEPKSVPLYALFAFQMRTELGKQIVNDCFSNPGVWAASMECSHMPSTDELLYDGRYYAIEEAPEEMLKCVRRNHIVDYKGKRLAYVLGGRNGSVEFTGAGITKRPADPKSKLLYIVSKPELASTGNGRYWHTVASVGEVCDPDPSREMFEIIDELHSEIASIDVIGRTSLNDGHSHDVLSDGTIMPFNGHSHYIKTFSVLPGNKPRFTAVCNESFSPVTVSEVPNIHSSKVHSHTVSIELLSRSSRKKNTNENTESASDTADIGLLHLINEINQQEHGEDSMATKTTNAARVSELLGKLSNAIKGISQGKSLASSEGVIPESVSSEIKAIAEELNAEVSEEKVSARIEEVISERISSGSLIEAGKFKDAVAAEVEKARTEMSEQASRDRKLSERLAKISALGVDIEAVEEGRKTTISERIKKIPLDEDGEDIFESELERITMKVAALKIEQNKADNEVQTQVASMPRTFLITSAGNREQSKNEPAVPGFFSK